MVSSLCHPHRQRLTAGLDEYTLNLVSTAKGVTSPERWLSVPPRQVNVVILSPSANTSALRTCRRTKGKPPCVGTHASVRISEKTEICSDRTATNTVVKSVRHAVHGLSRL